jgi:hypothetical protein
MPCPAHPLGHHYFVFFSMPPSHRRGVTVCIDCGKRADARRARALSA